LTLNQLSQFRGQVQAALSLIRDPFTDIGRTASEFDAFVFDLNQKLHSVTADQLYRGKFDGDDSASIERIANDVQVFLREPTADVKDQTPFSRKSVDSARHWLASPFVYPHCFKGKRSAVRM